VVLVAGVEARVLGRRRRGRGGRGRIRRRAHGRSRRGGHSGQRARAWPDCQIARLEEDGDVIRVVRASICLPRGATGGRGANGVAGVMGQNTAHRLLGTPIYLDCSLLVLPAAPASQAPPVLIPPPAAPTEAASTSYTPPQSTHNGDRTLAELRLPAPQTEHKGALLVHCTRAQASADPQRAQQQRHRQLLRHHQHARHHPHRAALVLEEARRRRRRRLRQDMSAHQLQLRQLPRGTQCHAMQRVRRRANPCRNMCPPYSRTTSPTHRIRPPARWSSLRSGTRPARRNTTDCGRSPTPRLTSSSCASPSTAPTH
jgi:hypothetical protein